jgi:xanthine dehydrogenase accessory factor
MREVLPQIDEWLKNQNKIAIATVIQTWGSSPRQIGAKMAMTLDGKIAGSVSGGCVEGAVFEEGVQSIQSGRPKYVHFGVADETAWHVGLACGGQVDVFVQPLDEQIFRQVRQKLDAHQGYATATVVEGPQELLGWQLLVSRDDLKTRLRKDGPPEILFDVASQALQQGRSRLETVQLGPGQEGKVFVEVVAPPARLVMVGGVHTSIVLAQLAALLGFETIVIDPRKAFANLDRFGHVDRLIQAWPEDAFPQVEIHDNTAIAVLTHDPKIDDPALIYALNTSAFYVGALGSAHTQAKRRERLLAAGIKPEQLERLHGPIGLPLGGQTPEEIALAILAEIIAVRHAEKNSEGLGMRAKGELQRSGG